ncbi:hypothetical protein N7G274_000570 [Stereocaulon virgatum]|uniref:Uncharacterized protein n=1 Tax=Stereocaulon virgatum TaxID=373712 RepID=A0ABR4ASI7_9LECA
MTDKFVLPSISIEKLLHEFALTYKWDQNLLGQPGRPNKGVGPRNLWCYWIDHYLASIEFGIAAYLRDAKAFMSRPDFMQGSSNFARDYVNGEMTTGNATPTRMKFPRPHGPSVGKDRILYGIWAGLDKLGNKLGTC